MTEKKRIDPDTEVDLGAMVEADTSRSRGAVMAVRLSPDLVGRISSYAAARGITASEVLRRGAEQLVDGVAETRAVVYQTGTVIVGPGIVHGTLANGTGQSRREEAEQDSSTGTLTR